MRLNERIQKVAEEQVGMEEVWRTVDWFASQPELPESPIHPRYEGSSE